MSAVVDGKLSLYSSRDTPQATKDFFRGADSHSMTATLYEPASKGMTPLLTQAAGRIIYNQGYSDDDPEKTDWIGNYASGLEQAGVKVYRYSQPTDIHRIHMKTYTATSRGQDEALMSTGNLSASSMLTKFPTTELGRQILTHTSSTKLVQINLALKTTDRQDVADLRAIQNQVISQGTATSHGHFLVGGDADTALTRDISQVSSKGSILIASPYIDDPSLIDSLIQASKKGAQVSLITVDLSSGGYSGSRAAERRQLVSKLRLAGATVYMPDPSDPILPHYKGAVIEDGSRSTFYLGSHNLSRAANIGESLDLLYRGESAKIAHGIKADLLDDVTRLHFQKLAPYSTKMQQMGVTNEQLAPIFTNDYPVSFLIPSQHGASYFYERDNYNAERMNAGLPISSLVDEESFATSAYRLRHLGEGGQVPGYIRDYDREMNTPGLSYLVNMWGMSHGYGRIYREEDGFLPSLAGSVGAILDRSLIYYSSGTPDYLANAQEIDPTDGYTEKPPGFFQGTFSFAAKFITQTSQSFLLYMLVGIPFGLVSQEMFKFSIQGLLDISLGQGTKAASIGLVRGAAAMTILGPSFIGMTPEQAREELTRLRDTNGEVHSIFKPGYSSAISLYNLLENQRAGIFFDVTMRPFIEDIINPFDPRGASDAGRINHLGLQRTLNEFRDLVVAPIYLKQEAEGVGKWIAMNSGHEKAKLVFKSLDKLGSYLPINPFKWGWLGHNYTNPKLDMDPVTGRVVTKDFLSFAEVFSFTDLLRGLERLYYGGEYLRMVNSTTFIDATKNLTTGEQDIWAAARAKSKSALGLPGILIQRTISVLTRGISQVLGGNGVQGDIFRVHTRLRNLEKQMIGSNLRWNDTEGMREIYGNAEDIHRFLDNLLAYHSTVTRSGQEMEMIQKASQFYADQNFAVVAARNPYAALKSNEFLLHKTRWGLYSLAAIGISLMAEDLFSSTTAASLWSQFQVALHHNDLGATPEFSPAPLFRWGGGWKATVGSLAFSGFAVTTGLGVATITRGFNIERYHVADEAMQAVRDYAELHRMASGKSAQEFTRDILEVIGHNKIGGIVRPGEGFFKAFVLTTVGVLAAERFSRYAIANTLSIVRSIPFVGQALFGKGDAVLNENFTLVSQLTQVRAEVISRMHRGTNLSATELGAAYQIGWLTAMTPIVNLRPPRDKESEVVAIQSKIPFFKFHLTEILKDKQFDEAGNITNKGTLSWKFGFHSSPTIAIDISVASPIALNLNAKTPWGFSVVYNNEPDNVINYLQAIGTLGSTALFSAATALTTVEALSASTSILTLLGKDNRILKDLQYSANEMRVLVKGLMTGLEVAATVVNYPMNFPKAKVIDSIEMVKAIYTGSHNIAQTSSGKFLRVSGRAFRGVVGGWLGHDTFHFIAESLGANEDQANMISIAGIPVGAVGFAYTDKIHDAFSTQILGRVTSRFQLIGDLASRVPRINSKWWIVAGVIATAWAMTDSTFGLTDGMDKDWDAQGNESTDWIKKLSTIGLYTSIVAPSVIWFADIGKSPLDVLRDYEKYADAGGARSMTSVFSSFKAWVHKGYLNSYLDKTRTFLIQHDQARVQAKELTEAMKNDAALATSIQELKAERAIQISHILQGARRGTQADNIVKLWRREEFIRYSSGAGRSMRLVQGAVAVMFVSQLAGLIVDNIGYLRSGKGGNEAVDAFYDWADRNSPIANTFRLLSWKDKQTPYQYLAKDLVDDSSTGGLRFLSKRGAQIINPINATDARLDKTVQDLIAPFLLTPQHPYQYALPGVGISIRSGEYGTRYTLFAQTQSPLQDTSFSAYSQLPAFMFKLALKGNREYGTLVEEGMKIALQGTDIHNASMIQLRQVSLAVVSASASMHPLTSPRKYSQPISEGTTQMIAGDSLLVAALKLRMRRTEELSYQKTTSILMRMIDPNDLSIMSVYSNKMDPKSLLSAFSRDKNDVDLVGMLNAKNMGALVRHILAPGNQIVFDINRIKVDRFKHSVEVSQAWGDDSSEFLQDTSLSLDSVQTPLPGPFSLLTKALGITDSFISRIPFFGSGFPKLAAEMTMGVFGLIVLGGLGSSFLYTEQYDRYREAAELTRNLFGVTDVNDEKTYRAFTVHNRLGTDGFIQDNVYQVRRGRRQFTIRMPDGYNSQTFSYDANLLFQHVTMEMQKVDTALYESIFGEQVLDAVRDMAYTGRTKAEVVREISSFYDSHVGNLVGGMLDAYTRQHNGMSARDITSTRTVEEIEAMKGTIKAQIVDRIDKMLTKEIASNRLIRGTIGANLLERFTGITGERLAEKISFMVLTEIQPFLVDISQSLFFMTSDDSLGYAARASDRILEYVSSVGGHISGGKFLFTQGRLRTPRLATPGLQGRVAANGTIIDRLDRLELVDTARATRMAGIGKALHFGESALWNVISGIDALGVYTSFNRLSSFEEDPHRTTGDVNYAAQSVGESLILDVGSNVIVYAAYKALQSAAPALLAAAAKSPTRAGLIAAGVIVAGSLLYGFRSYIEEQWDKSWINRSTQGFFKNLGSFVQKTYERVAEGLGDTVVALDRGLSKALPFIKPGTVTSLIGGAAAITTFLFGVGKKLPAIIFGAAISGISNAVLHNIPGVSGMLNHFLTPLVDNLANIPGIGGLLASSSESPGESLMNKYYSPDSPIYSATANDAITMDSQRYLQEADPEGKKTASLFANPSWYGSGYRTDEPQAAIFARQQLTKPIMDSFLEQELAVRSQYYNQSVVGATSWNRMIATAQNFQQLKEITWIQKMSNPMSTFTHNIVQATQEKETKQLQALVKAKGNVNNIAIHMVEYYRKTKSIVNKPTAKMRTSIKVNKGQDVAPSLTHKLSMVTTPDNQPVQVFTYKANQEDKVIKVNKTVSVKNDIALAVASSANAYYAMPGYTS